MNDMPAFQPNPPMFEDLSKPQATPSRKRRARKPRAQQPEPAAEPKGPKKPRNKPMRRKRRVGKSPLLAAPYGKPKTISKDILKVLNQFLAMPEADRELVVKLAKVYLK